jgi:hypothetical protein
MIPPFFNDKLNEPNEIQEDQECLGRLASIHQVLGGDENKKPLRLFHSSKAFPCLINGCKSLD